MVRQHSIRHTNAYLMLIQVQDGEEGVSIGLVTVYLHCRSEQWLCQNQICDGRQIEQLSINIEKLLEQSLDTVEVYFWLRIKPFEINV